MPPPTSYSSVERISPRSISDAFAVVPPMSKVMMLACPARPPKRAAPTTPAAGPLSTTMAGFLITCSTSIVPPLDCIITSGASNPCCTRRCCRERRYVVTSGPTYAFTTVVLVRSYSRISGNTSLDIETKHSGSAAENRSPMRRSCRGFT
jgi:hypothetical protein